jgi:hypothetical protein
MLGQRPEFTHAKCIKKIITEFSQKIENRENRENRKRK